MLSSIPNARQGAECPGASAERCAVTAPSAPAAGSGQLNVNTATVAELVKIKGVGPVLAARIIAARPFKSPEELRRVKGIGPKTYAKIRPYFGP